MFHAGVAQRHSDWRFMHRIVCIIHYASLDIFTMKKSLTYYVESAALANQNASSDKPITLICSASNLLQARFCLAYSSTLNMEAKCSTEKSVDLQWTTQRYTLEQRTFHNRRCEKLSSYKRCTEFARKPKQCYFTPHVLERNRAMKVQCFWNVYYNILTAPVV
jgi:hypothetical protein